MVPFDFIKLTPLMARTKGRPEIEFGLLDEPIAINRNTNFIEKFFVRVDVTEEFPFLATKLSPYCDRLT